MKSKTKQFEKIRFRRDYLFRLLVTFCGLLVLAIFATLLLHILSNALPLVKSPSAEKVNSVSNAKPSRNIGSMQLQGQWIHASIQECSLYLYSASHTADTKVTTAPHSAPISATQADTVKKFAPNCAKHVVGLAGPQNQHVIMLASNNVLEVHLLENIDTLVLKASVSLPASFSQANVYDWQVSFVDDEIFIQRPVDNAQQTSGIATLSHRLSSFNEPVVKTYVDALYLLPIAKFKQVIVANERQLRMYNKDNKLIEQRFLLDDGRFSDAQYPAQVTLLGISAPTVKDIGTAAAYTNAAAISGLSITPSSLDIFVRVTKNATNATSGDSRGDGASGKRANDTQSDRQIALTKFTLINDSGAFMLSEVLSVSMPNALGTGAFYSAFDLQHNAGFFIDERGHFVLMNIITGDIMIDKRLETSVNEAITYLNYAQGQLQLSVNNGTHLYEFSEMQGMTSAQLLFGKNNYAGYRSEAFVWQTSVSSASQSPKYSVVPLVMGSIKASMLALVVALPLALGAAIYTAYFAPRHIRSAIKPSIEMLEAIPSVIIGFIAAVWLAPFAEQYLISIFFVIVLLPFVVLMIGAIHGYFQHKFGSKMLDSWQLPLNVMLLLAAMLSIFLLSLSIVDWSSSAGHSQIQEWASGITLSKTAIVVSLALGVAIAPTIYTLIDDALFEVPEGVKQASFALGATKIQTLVKVVLVVAFPSIISATMLGFGRAFGETMIVLMVTGNTPIANWDLLSGLRTLTSNLAIELQEAPVDSTVYHILFLTAAILFAFTFLVNTVAALLKRSAVKHER